MCYAVFAERLEGSQNSSVFFIRARTSEGRFRAKARGVKMGQKPKLASHQQREAIKRCDVDGEAIRDIARSYRVHNSTMTRLQL